MQTHQSRVTKMFMVAVCASSWLLLVITLVSLFWARSFLLELTTHFRPFYAVAGLCLLAFLVWRRRWIHTGAALLAVILNFAPMAPLWFGGVDDGLSGKTYKILFANVFYNNHKHEALADLVVREQPDLILLVEVSPAWKKALADLTPAYPYHVIEERTSAFGLAALSRVPQTELSIVHHPPDGFPVGLIRVGEGAAQMTLVLDHPMAPIGVAQAGMRNRHLSETAALVADIEGPVALIGDLNTTMWSPYFHDLLRDARLENGRRGWGLLNTWPAHLPLLRIPIDHVLTRQVLIKDLRLGPSTGSDHLPLLMELAPAP